MEAKSTISSSSARSGSIAGRSRTGIQPAGSAETVYGYKTLIEEGSGHILGAHLVGPHFDEVINLFALAIRRDLTAEDLKQTIFAYPTGASDIGYML